MCAECVKMQSTSFLVLKELKDNTSNVVFSFYVAPKWPEQLNKALMLLLCGEKLKWIAGGTITRACSLYLTTVFSNSVNL